MQLVEFRVRNYRSVNDSGTIDVRRRTPLVGPNESGKSNLLLALRSLKTPDGVKALSKIKDFPKDRRMSDFSEDLPVVDSRWELSPEDQAGLALRYGRARDVRFARISRGYAPVRSVELEGLPHLGFDANRVHHAIRGLGDARNRLAAINATLGDEIGTLLEAATPAGELTESDGKWAESARNAVLAFRKYLGTAQVALDQPTAQFVEDLASQSSLVADDRSQYAEAKAFLLERLPVFLYLPDYPELDGHIDLEALLQRMEAARTKESDDNFLKLMKVAGLDPKELVRLLPKNHELRSHLVNRGGAVVTRTIRRLWTSKSLKVRFNLDANHFDILLSDPNSAYDVEVNLDERSRGFRWFFSFYVTCAADTEGGLLDNAILLLDEPGLHLHPIAQRDLLETFARDFKNQILYTTHSPFMLPVEDLASVRTVRLTEAEGTTVRADPGEILDPITAERAARLLAALRHRSEAAA